MEPSVFADRAFICVCLFSACAPANPEGPAETDLGKALRYAREVPFRSDADLELAGPTDPLVLFSDLMNYTQHRLEARPAERVVVNGVERLVQSPADLLVFYKEQTDPSQVILRAQELTAENCSAIASCSGVTRRAPTPFSLSELRSLEAWLSHSPLGRWLFMHADTPTLLADGALTDLPLIVEAPRSALDTLVEMLRLAVPDRMYRLVPLRPFQS